jgi:hypothetical protein
MSETNQPPHDEVYDSDSEDEWLRAANDEPTTTGVTSSTAAAGGASAPKQLDFSYDPDERVLAGNKVGVYFTLPDGRRVGPEGFFMGLTIAHMKARVEEAYGVNYDQQKMVLVDPATGVETELLDPLSLNDLPFSATADNEVKVLLA